MVYTIKRQEQTKQDNKERRIVSMTKEQRKEALIKLKNDPEIWEKYKRENTMGRMFYLCVALMNQDQVNRMIQVISEGRE